MTHTEHRPPEPPAPSPWEQETGTLYEASRGTIWLESTAHPTHTEYRIMHHADGVLWHGRTDRPLSLVDVARIVLLNTPALTPSRRRMLSRAAMAPRS